MLQPGGVCEEESENRRYRCARSVPTARRFRTRQRAIGGGALEAAERFEKIKGHYAVVILAAGKGTRFSGEHWGKQTSRKDRSKADVYAYDG